MAAPRFQRRKADRPHEITAAAFEVFLHVHFHFQATAFLESALAQHVAAGACIRSHRQVRAGDDLGRAPQFDLEPERRQ